MFKNLDLIYKAKRKLYLNGFHRTGDPLNPVYTKEESYKLEKLNTALDLLKEKN